MNHPATAWPFPGNKRPLEPLVLDGDTVVASLTPPALGAVWPEQGGAFVGMILRPDGQGHDYLIAAIGVEADFSGRWGESGEYTEGATSSNDGSSNTRAMAEADSKLAQCVLALDHDGKSDWHIPSQDELALCFINARNVFAPDVHWTSTQYSADEAWSQSFADGLQVTWAKYDVDRIRPVRRVSVSE